MGNINASQLAFLMKCPVKDAQDMITYCNLRFEKFHDSEFASISDLQDYLKVDIEGALHDIKHNYMKRNATRMFLLEFPLKRWESRDIPPKTISLPRVLSSLISDEVKEEIKSMWESNYGYMIRAGVHFRV